MQSKPCDSSGTLESFPNLYSLSVDRRWITKTDFFAYMSLVKPGGHGKTGIDLEEWKYQAHKFHKNLRFLLRLEHHKFWSYVIFEKTVMASVSSFLQESTPFYLDLDRIVPDNIAKNVYNDILRDVVRIFCRLVTNKEADNKWISKIDLKNLIYSNYLITIPMLMDLILACGEGNSKIVKKIFETVIQIQPNYEKDLEHAVQNYPKALSNVVQEIEDLENSASGAYDLDTPYDEVVLFSLDCAYTLSILLDIWPPARGMCATAGVQASLSRFYDSTIPNLWKNIHVINPYAIALNWLNHTRIQLLRSYRAIVNFFIEEVLNDPAKSLEPSEKIISIFTESLADKTFVIDYERMYPIEVDFEILKQACDKLDNFKADYILNAYVAESESALKDLLNRIAITEDSPAHNKKAQKKIQPALAPQKQRNVDSEIENVLEILPHLGTGFIRKLLQRYDNHEEAIAAVLEGNLPPDLSDADQTEVYIPPEEAAVLPKIIPNNRNNIFDGDQYDVMTNDNPNCVIKRGKGLPGGPKNLSQMLDDKTAMNQVRQRYEEYSLITEDIDENDPEYNDEYDDSYEALLEGEIKTKKTEAMKQVILDIEEESESEEENPPENNSRMNFCENPEAIRARYEANRAAKMANKKNYRPPPVPKDVVGKVKGKGQEKDVLLNRHKKDVNKSSRANHSRKSGATWKRSRGMIPS